MHWSEQRDGETTPQWLTRVLRDERASATIIAHVRQRLAEEKAWLLVSMATDQFPEWLVEMVLERWGKDPSRILREYIRPAILDMRLVVPDQG